MAKYLFFSVGSGLNLREEGMLVSSDNIQAINPVTTTTTVMWIKTHKRGRDKIIFTHDNTATADPSPGHRCKDISRAVAEACNAGPHATMVDMVDLDNSIFYGNLSFITAMAITKNA